MKTSTTALILGAMTLAAMSQAQSLKYTGTNLPDTKSAKITVLTDSPKTVKAGALNFTNGSSTLTTYCADARSPLDGAFHGYSSMTVDTTAASGLAIAGRIVGQGIGTATNADKQAGLQLAIWSALYDGGANFNANGANFKVQNVSNSILNYAASYYSAGKNSVLPSTVQVTLYATTAQGGQSQLAVSTVPEPFSMATLGLGLAGLAARRRRK